MGITTTKKMSQSPLKNGASARQQFKNNNRRIVELWSQSPLKNGASASHERASFFYGNYHKVSIPSEKRGVCKCEGIISIHSVLEFSLNPL